jgi:hypothetical protein
MTTAPQERDNHVALAGAAFAFFMRLSGDQRLGDAIDAG